MFKWALAVGVLLISNVVIAQGQVATYPSEKGKVSVTVIKKGLDYPWGLAFLPDQKEMLVTERPGRLRVLNSDGSVSNPIAGLPDVYNRSQGGLMDVALSPSFAEDRLIYLSYSEGGGEDDKAGTAVGRGTLSADMTRVEGFTVIFRQEPKLSTGAHFGSRLVFDQQGYLFIALGENNQRITAQELDKLQGKLVRIKADGTVPNDNPFVGQSGARPEIWSYGHRNQQGAALNPWTGQVWTNEHGPRGGDEVNIPLAGKNYGWPLATHGINYSYTPIPEAKGKDVPGTEQPLYVWEKSPGVSGMAFYSADRFPAWKNSLFIGALAQESLIRLQLEGDKVVHEERLLEEKGARIRDVRQGPDGYLYVLTDSSEGEVLKIGLE
ncbi:PQQ-dependent sugar dehydrogenase [Pseudomonas sp. WAC2]|uniref:PQQ-dependent sugar dehydrogenase n=1 Tax=Pseudomonas TaxID=286 RepID=UPI0025B249CA|nr:PQQ-dependent sugar dehydrogenase [Pseudomonas sp. WAC2]MDN3236490.1 PQQ-dependent sugar dehydrogenase [Pseudomonas sp. WAC2]